jgi:hypothetical protein
VGARAVSAFRVRRRTAGSNGSQVAALLAAEVLAVVSGLVVDASADWACGRLFRACLVWVAKAVAVAAVCCGIRGVDRGDLMNI